MAHVTQCQRCGEWRTTGRPHGCWEGQIKDLQERNAKLTAEVKRLLQLQVRARNSLRRALRMWKDAPHAE